jgi:ferritin
LAWFIKEQIEEEATSSKIAGEIEMVGDSKSALLMLDRELGGRAFPLGSPFDPLAYAQAT